MTFQSAPECAEAVLHFDRNGTSMANVLNFWFPGGYIQANIAVLADVVDDVVGSHYLQWISTDIDYTGTVVRGLQSSVDLTATDVSSVGPGTEASGDGLPSNVTLCVGLKSGFTGRSARGRFYAQVPTSGMLTASESFTSTYGNGIVAFLDEVKTQALAAGWKLIVLSRQIGGIIRPTAYPYTVNSIAYRNLLTDSMKSRLAPGH